MCFVSLFVFPAQHSKICSLPNREFGTLSRPALVPATPGHSHSGHEDPGAPNGAAAASKNTFCYKYCANSPLFKAPLLSSATIVPLL